jgi:serine/threonine protein kinase
MFQPQRFGRYLLIRKLATGGMAEIFLAKLVGAAGFEKELVIKKILPQWSSDRDFISMLIDEAKIAVQLNHPNIVQVYELAREEETFYIAMEYVNGVDLRRLMQKAAGRKKKIPLDVGLTILSEVLDGLAYAHSKKDPQGQPLQIIHRDISPQNVLVSFDGHAKITDFGIAKAASRSQETMIGVLKGKFAYMSPEQANQDPLDARSDLFSAAIVLYELLSGERLFYRGSDLETLDRVRGGQITFSEAAEKLLPAHLREVLLKALSKEREGRYPDAASFSDDLHKVARRSKKTLRRERVASFLSSLFEEEIQGQMEEKTRLLTQATALLMEETKTAGEKEIFVQRKEVAAERPPFLRRLGERREILVGGVLILMAASIIFLFATRQPRQIAPPAPSMLPSAPPRTSPSPPEVAPPVKEAQAIPAGPETAPVPAQPPAPVVSLEPKKKIETATGENGFVSVQAVPWGYVSVDGAGRRETPVRRLPLKPGRHSIRVVYEPDGASVSTAVNLQSAQEIVCVANFRGTRGISCR